MTLPEKAQSMLPHCSLTMQFLASFRCFGTSSRGTGGNHGSPDDAGEFKKKWIPIIKQEAKKRKARMKIRKQQDELQAQLEARIEARIARIEARLATSNGKKKERKLQKAPEDIYSMRTATGTSFTVKTIHPGHHIYIIT